MTARGPRGASTMRRGALRFGPLAIAGLASIGAGAIHASELGFHRQPSAMGLFMAIAVFQIGWGALALSRQGGALSGVGIAGNYAVLAAWALSLSLGIPMDEGVGDADHPQFADGLAWLLTAVAASGALAGRPRVRGRNGAPRLRTPAVVAAAGLVLGLTVAGMVTIGDHQRATDHAQGATAHGPHATGDHGASAVPPKPYDPTRPVDLGGVDGVTPQQQARAENLVVATLARLPQFADPTTATAAGYQPIDAGLTTDEHYVNWRYINDDKMLDPDHPESLVYRVAGDTKSLVAAMFILREGSSLGDVPDIGGPLTRWHVHEDLCFTPEALGSRLVQAVAVHAACPPPSLKRLATPMIHVWIVPHRCGPFAEIEGVGRQARVQRHQPPCGHAHGSTGSS